MPPDPRDWLPEGHLTWFVLASVEQMDLSAFFAAIGGRQNRIIDTASGRWTPSLPRLAGLKYPPGDSLVVVERPRDGVVGLDIPEPGTLQGSIWRHVEGIGLAIEATQRQCVEVEPGRLAHPGGSNA